MYGLVLRSTSERSDVVVDVWKDRNVFKRLRGHLSDLEKSKKSYAGEVEVMVWTPPTWTRRRLFEGCLGTLKKLTGSRKSSIKTSKGKKQNVSKSSLIRPMSPVIVEKKK